MQSQGGRGDSPASPAVTKLVSDRATRFSGVTTAVPFDSGARNNSQHNGGSSGWCGSTYDSNDYWDGYNDGHRDGYRRGYRNGYSDGRWDDCWSPRHRWGGWYGWGVGWGSSCWSGWSFSIGWSAPVVYYSSPVYYYTPVYRSSVVYSSTSWYGASSVTTTTYYDPSPRCEIVDFCDVVAAPTTTIVYAAAPTERVVDVNLPSYQPTVYRSDELAGVLGWNDTPDAVVGALMSVSPSDRAAASANYLGRVPAGGWDVGFEADKVVDGERQLWFRSLTPGPRGQRALVVMYPKTSVPTMYAGQRVQITGRVAEICVDDPFEQGGRVTLGDGSVKY